VTTGRFATVTGARNSAADDLYCQIYPYHAELCVLTEIRKKPGDGVPLHSGIGGHSVLYLNGVFRDRQVGYPTLKLCDAEPLPASKGVGISVNAHYSNANWIATDGPDFLWWGALEPGETLSRARYEQTQERAKAMGLLDGVAFHTHLFRDKPSGMSDTDYMYEISIASDYAVQFGRDTLRVRIPLDRARMGAIAAFLNALNAPYRDGAQVFKWRVLNNNCSHVAHNALAHAGIWNPWPTGQFFLTAAFNFPVPKNEFVDLVTRTNDLPIDDAAAMFKDESARHMLLNHNALPTRPGALVTAEPAVPDNELYNIEGLRLIFFDTPWGPYRPRLARILGDSRYSDLRANLRHFESVYAAAAKHRRIPAKSDRQADFYRCYDEYILREATNVRKILENLEQLSQAPVEPVA
jgi:hypothetical protein